MCKVRLIIGYFMSLQVLNGIRQVGNYSADFLLGTSSSTMGKCIGTSIKNRKANNMGFVKSLRVGFADGFVKSNSEVQAAGGFFKNLGQTIWNLPKNMKKGWIEGTGKNGFTKFFSKFGKSLKPLGKLMPFAMNALWLAMAIPDIVERTKDEGILGGLKETGKTVVNLATIALTSSIGACFGPIGMFGLPIIAGMGVNALLGSSYKLKKSEAEKQKQLASQQNNPFAQQGQNLDIRY